MDDGEEEEEEEEEEDSFNFCDNIGRIDDEFELPSSLLACIHFACAASEPVKYEASCS